MCFKLIPWSLLKTINSWKNLSFAISKYGLENLGGIQSGGKLLTIEKYFVLHRNRRIMMYFSRTIEIFTLVEFLCLANFMLCHEHSSNHPESHSCGNLYSEACNVDKKELTDEEMFQCGHMKPFGSHRPPDHIVEELQYMISPQDFYMNYVVKHKPVVFKGILLFVALWGLKFFFKVINVMILILLTVNI